MTPAQMATLRFPDASDLEPHKIKRLSDLINAVYDDAESGMWLQKGTWTHPAEVERLLRERALILAEIEDLLVGSVNVNRMDGGIAAFGMLVVDREYRGKGIGLALVQHAEQWAREHACHIIRLELVTPRHWKHPFKEYLRQWYSGMGYVPQRTGPFESMHPALSSALATPCDFTVWHKPLV